LTGLLGVLPIYGRNIRSFAVQKNEPERGTFAPVRLGAAASAACLRQDLPRSAGAIYLDRAPPASLAIAKSAVR
jgi:hypothetical protein